MSLLPHVVRQALEGIPSDRTQYVVLSALKQWERSARDVTNAFLVSPTSFPQRIAAISEQAEREGRLDERARERFRKGPADPQAARRR